MSAHVFGIDFDNTIVDYGNALHGLAVDRGLIAAEVEKNKAAIRAQVRQRPDGEIEWQRLQAAAYGPQIHRAELAKDFCRFLRTCASQGCEVFIVSHKSEYATQDETGTNLRDAASIWMNQHQFFDHNGTGLKTDHVFFENTRRDKLKRVGSLGCTHMIDDLEETFLDESFPDNVIGILYAPGGSPSSVSGVMVAQNWLQIVESVFGVFD